MAKTNTKRVALWASTILSLAVPCIAEAQTYESDDIVVTARRREERQQDVPIAVTALSGAALEQRAIPDFVSLTSQAPSLIIVPGGGANNSSPAFSIRGQSQQEITMLSDQSVGVYLNDIAVPRTQGMNGSLFDIAAVEVLRGPQGTLFGRNTTGGAIVIRPNTPSDILEGGFGVTIGNFDTVQTDVMLNLPLNDWARVRFAGQSRTSDGWLYDTLLQRNVNTEDREGFRLSLEIEPSSRFSSLLTFDWANRDDGGQTGVISAINPLTGFNAPGTRTALNYPQSFEQMLATKRALGNEATASGLPSYARSEVLQVSNTTSFELTDSLTLRNIIGYRHLETADLLDADGLPIPILDIQRIDEGESFSNELQLLGDGEKLDWIVGLYYFTENGENQGISVTGGVDPGLIHPNNLFVYPGWANTWVGADNTSYAIFAQGTYDLASIVDGLSVTAGARLNRDERVAFVYNRTRTACRINGDNGDADVLENNPLPLADCRFRGEATFEEPTWNISLDYQISEDQLVYVAHRHGYRTGGFGARASTLSGLARTFRPEIVDDIELGLKSDWRSENQFFRMNLAVYYAQYQDIQRQLQDVFGLPPTTVVANADEAHVQGAELELLYRFSDWLELSGFISYTDAAFDRFIALDGVTDLSNQEFARAPRRTISVTPRVNLPLADNLGDVSLSVNYYHLDDYAGTDTGVPLVAGHDLVNFYVDWSNFMGSDLDLNFYVKNAFDHEYDSSLLAVPPLGFDARIPGEPTTYGVTLRYRWGAE